MTGRLPDEVLFIGAMDIDKTFPSVFVVGFDPIEPKDAGSDEVAFFIPVGWNGDRYTSPKNGVQRLVASDFLINPKTPERRLEAPSCLTQAETGGRNRELMNDLLFVEKEQSLCFYIDPDLVTAHFLSKVSGR